MEQAIIDNELGESNAARGISEVNDSESEEIKEVACLHQEGVQHREIKRPGNNRSWLSKEDRTRISADVTSASIDQHETRTEIAKRYGVVPSTVTDIANNTRRALDTNRSVDQAQIDRSLDAVREAAIERLMSGLNKLTDDKIDAHNGKEISAICSNMAKVVQQTIPQDKAAQAINLIVYTPEMRKEQHFDVIEVGE